MSCPCCNRDDVGDPDVGYSANHICEQCACDGWIETASGEIVNERDEQDIEVSEYDQVRR